MFKPRESSLQRSFTSLTFTHVRFLYIDNNRGVCIASTNVTYGGREDLGETSLTMIFASVKQLTNYYDYLFAFLSLRL